MDTFTWNGRHQLYKIRASEKRDYFFDGLSTGVVMDSLTPVNIFEALNIATKTWVPSEEFPWGAKNIQTAQIEFGRFLHFPILSTGESIEALHSDQLAL